MWMLGKVALQCMYVFISASNSRNLPAIQKVVVLKMLHTHIKDRYIYDPKLI